jgi:hypothetical protein
MLSYVWEAVLDGEFETPREENMFGGGVADALLDALDVRLELSSGDPMLDFSTLSFLFLSRTAKSATRARRSITWSDEP